ncbi:hypothetical protein [Chthonomonas calidirosea]|nr:hypothetical protein [Chthonomonas calidirosea]
MVTAKRDLRMADKALVRRLYVTVHGQSVSTVLAKIGLMPTEGY